MPTRNVDLTEHLDRFVAGEIAAGRYRDVSEVMRAGLRLLEDQSRETEQKLTVLRALAAEGFAELDQGQGIELDGPEEFRAFVARLGREAPTTARDRSPPP